MLVIAAGWGLIMPLGASNAQTKKIVHPPQAGTGLPGLIRPFSPELAHYTIPLDPSWVLTETYDSSRGLATLVGTMPDDSLVLMFKCISRPANGNTLTSGQWGSLKDQLRSGYGDRKVGTMVLFDTTLIGHPVRGVIAIFEILARMPDHLEFAAAVVTTREILLITAPIVTEEAAQRISYYRSILSELRERE